ncbi:mitochondrial tRNA methylthiotransferase CDK5RAP1 isoform X5 [Vidua chalybeata]|uniref:mitochondrial tRNA methylthiotransferase CDK5RAP1 isoform X5 n=1 Tax=Vidua chalybeata TaxID=81927 RepID=UPI0023A82D56|nr:mitochondrial tRNA methylthiotransferase CDK5RAP1 isoform X5 [Vidua chalybeata]
MLPGARALRAAGLLRPPGAVPRTGVARRARRGSGQRPVGRGFALPAGPDLRHFLRAAAAGQPRPSPELPPEPGSAPGAPKVYLETYGCQMNVSDTEIVWAILQKNGYARTKELEEADVVLLVTCSVRSIMRGCDNMCSYCIVPFTRGRERSRPIASILQEVRMLSDQGVKEVTLLGQNVNSFRDLSEVQFQSVAAPGLSRGFRTVYKAKAGGLRFSHLLDQVSRIDPEMRIRFTSPHPKDFPDEVLQLIQERHNICKQLHLPAQSGSTRILEAMRRGYTREAYLELVHHVRDSIPGVSLSSDFIAGFCGETEEDHLQTVSLLREVRYSIGFLFAYSMRQKTRAHHRLQDDVPADVKKRRLEQLIAAFREEAARANAALVGQAQLVLVEGPSKRSASELCGRNDGNIKVIFPDTELEDAAKCGAPGRAQPGDYVMVKVTSASSQTLRGVPLCRTTLSRAAASH